MLMRWGEGKGSQRVCRDRESEASGCEGRAERTKQMGTDEDDVGAGGVV